MAGKSDANKILDQLAASGGLSRPLAESNVKATTESILPIATPIIKQPPENVDFIERFDATRISIRPTKIVVLSQDPEPDVFIPAGTPVNLVMAMKEDLPVESFSNIETAVTDKYPQVGTLIEDLRKPNDPFAGAAKRVLEEKSELKYEELSTQDAKAVNDFIKNRFNIGTDSQADKDQAKKVYDNLRFLNSF